MHRYERRSILVGAGTACAATLAGCLDGGDGRDDGPGGTDDGARSDWIPAASAVPDRTEPAVAWFASVPTLPDGEAAPRGLVGRTLRERIDLFYEDAGLGAGDLEEHARVGTGYSFSYDWDSGGDALRRSLAVTASGDVAVDDVATALPAAYESDGERGGFERFTAPDDEAVYAVRDGRVVVGLESGVDAVVAAGRDEGARFVDESSPFAHALEPVASADLATAGTIDPMSVPAPADYDAAGVGYEFEDGGRITFAMVFDETAPAPSRDVVEQWTASREWLADPEIDRSDDRIVVTGADDGYEFDDHWVLLP